MVLTRSQSAKQKAKQSPQSSPAKFTKQPRKQRGSGSGGDTTTADEELPQQELSEEQQQAQQQQQQQQQGGRQRKQSAMGGRLTKLKAQGTGVGPSSHPLSSLPASPAGVAPAAGFTIPAGQQEELGEALAATSLGAAQHSSESESGPSAMSIEGQQQQQEGSDGRAAAVAVSQDRQAPASSAAAAAAAAEAEAAQQQQQAQPPRPQPRPEKLLKRLPDKAIPCDKLPDGPEPVQVEVEYPARADLQPVADPVAALATAVAGMNSSDWVEVVKSLTLMRQLTAHHADACTPQLRTLFNLVLKSVRSLRSSVCKTAIMATCDMYEIYGDALLPMSDVGGQVKPLTSMLAQILLKCASNDKKFVIEEAQRALQIMVGTLAPARLLPLLLPYADLHKNPKMRGKAGVAVADTLARMAPADLAAAGLPRLLKVAGKLLTDNTPDARESAKRVIDMLKTATSDPAVEPQLVAEAPKPPAAAAVGGEGEEAGVQPSLWETLCRTHLSASAEIAVRKVSTD